MPVTFVRETLSLQARTSDAARRASRRLKSSAMLASNVPLAVRETPDEAHQKLRNAGMNVA